jgi:tetratricopeptide (TPR) repeat protein
MIGGTSSRLAALAAASFFLISPVPHAVAQDAGDLLGRCQSEDVQSRQRVEACSKLVGDTKLEADLRAEALLNRGVAYEDLGKDAEALGDYTSAIALNPDYPAPYGYRGALHERLGRHDEAIKDHSVVLKLLPDDYDALHARGRSYLIVGNSKAALGDFEQLLKLDAKDPDALVGRAFAREDLGDKAGALADFKAALGIEPDNEDAKEGVDRLRGG